MLSILDILKRYQEEKNKNKDKYCRSSGADAMGENKPSVLDGVNASIAPVINSDLFTEESDRIKEFYKELLVWAKKVYKLEFVLSVDFKSRFTEIVEKELAFMDSAGKELLRLCLADYETREDALYYHVANVSIIALELGRGLGYEKQKLIELGVAGFMHDIGIIRFLELINKYGKLSPEELSKVKEHPLTGVEVLNKIGGEFIPGLTDVISQEHERLDGSGYPKGLKEAEIRESAQIVGLADVYEAMTHFRPYRVKFNPSKTMNTILNEKNAFSPKVLKVLLERIGIFPIGTMVRLNTKEIGMVLKINQGFPLRPLVMVLFDEVGNKLVPSSKQIDLSNNLLICIEECMEVSENQANG